MFSCLTLFHVISKCYGASVVGIIRRSPRLGILLVAICLAIIFTLMDILAVSVPGLSGSVDGYVPPFPCSTVATDLEILHRVNPYWKLALIFKCLTDNIMLDDFRTELSRIGGRVALGFDEAQRENAEPRSNNSHGFKAEMNVSHSDQGQVAEYQ